MGFLAKLAGWFFGGGKTVDKVTEIADEAFHTEEEKAAETAAAVDVDQRDLASARAMQMAGHASWLDIIVDAWSRVIRPGVTTYLIGGWIGWWHFPAPNSIDPFWQNVSILVLTFWFGGRALLKDLPDAIRKMRGL